MIFQFHDGAIGSRHQTKNFDGYILFQFHDGAIGRHSFIILVTALISFQFHDGAIGSVKPGRRMKVRLRFNSMMVRLEA